MKRTVVAAPALALAALSLGFGAQPAAADPLPLPTSLVDQVVGLLPVPTPSPSASLLPVPLPVPLPTAAPTPSLAPAPAAVTTRTADTTGAPRVHSESGTRPVVQAAAPSTSASMTGSTSGLRLSSATMPAWASAYLGRTMAPTLAQAAPTAPAPLTALRVGGSGSTPSGLPTGTAALAVAVLVVTAGGHVLVRRGLVPLR